MQLIPFDNIIKLAEDRKGGKVALEKLLASHKPLSIKQLEKVSDDRYLSMMTRCVFYAGFLWKIIDNKWSGFEEAFYGFNPKGLAHLAPEQWDKYNDDERVVRHSMKIKSVLDNAHFVWATAAEHGSFGKVFAAWPANDQVGLMAWLKKEGSRLGASTAAHFIRFSGKDGFNLSNDVVARLRASGVAINDYPSSKKELVAVQEAFNRWHAETKLSYTDLSRIAGMSIGPNYRSEPAGRSGDIRLSVTTMDENDQRPRS